MTVLPPLAIIDHEPMTTGAMNAAESQSLGRRSLANAVAELRPLQWTKNLLLFVPLTMAHSLTDLRRLAAAAIGAVAFCALASAAYCINDLADLDHDRLHPTKCRRPLARGDLTTGTVKVLASVLAVIGLAVSAIVSVQFAALAAVYFALTLAYSFALKRALLIDIVVLAMLYTLRIVAGGVATTTRLSEWLLSFVTFLFLGLALLKRYAETAELARSGGDAAPGRPYSAHDAGILRSLGVAAGMVSILVFALYINSEHVRTLYSRPAALWLACPCLFYALGRMWILADRGELRDDPIVFAASDAVTFVVGAAVGLILVIAA